MGSGDVLASRNCRQLLRLEDGRFSRRAEEWLSPEPEHPSACTGELGQSVVKDHGQISGNVQEYPREYRSSAGLWGNRAALQAGWESGRVTLSWLFSPWAFSRYLLL